MKLRKVLRFVFGIGTGKYTPRYITTKFLEGKFEFNPELSIKSLDLACVEGDQNTLSFNLEILQETNPPRFSNPDGVMEPTAHAIESYFSDPINQLKSDSQPVVIVKSESWEDCFYYQVSVIYDFPYSKFGLSSRLSAMMTLLLKYIKLLDLPRQFLSDLAVVEETQMHDNGTWKSLAEYVKEKCGLVPLASDAHA